MIFFSKLFTVAVLPPGCIIAALILIIIFIPRRFKIFLSLVTALLYALSMQPVADALIRPLENAYPPLSIADDDITVNQTEVAGEAAAGESSAEEASDTQTSAIQAVVILGGGTVIGSPEAEAGQDSLGSDAMKRLIYAFTLRDRFQVPYVFSGGKVFDYGQDPEAVTAGKLLASLGLPPERIITESNSRNTWENAQKTAQLGYTHVIMVTSAYHIPRSVYCFEHNGITAIPAPTDYKSDRGRPYDILSFLPTMPALENSYIALHEYVGSLCYRIIYR